MLKTADGSINGSLKVVESIKNNKKNKKKSKDNTSDWTWKEQVCTFLPIYQIQN
jgi:myosin XV